MTEEIFSEEKFSCSSSSNVDSLIEENVEINCFENDKHIGSLVHNIEKNKALILQEKTERDTDSILDPALVENFENVNLLTNNKDSIKADKKKINDNINRNKHNDSKDMNLDNKMILDYLGQNKNSKNEILLEDKHEIKIRNFSIANKVSFSNKKERKPDTVCDFNCKNVKCITEESLSTGNFQFLESCYKIKEKINNVSNNRSKKNHRVSIIDFIQTKSCVDVNIQN